MTSRAQFAEGLAEMHLTHVERAVALLWFYRETQTYEERSPAELAADLYEEDFPRPKVSRLSADLRVSNFTIRGRRDGTYQLDLRRLPDLAQRYSGLLNLKRATVPDSILPSAWVASTRTYLERMVNQINGCYEYGFYDGCATLCRRLMESLIIEIYVKQKRHHEVQTASGVFIQLEALIRYVKADTRVPLSRNARSDMDGIKQLGDTAAHDRTYVTEKVDVDDIKLHYRRLINELLSLSGIRP
jgi:hypothetical protein